MDKQENVTNLIIGYLYKLLGLLTSITLSKQNGIQAISQLALHNPAGT